MFCTQCGSPTNDGARYCKGCGAPLPGAETVPPSPNAERADQAPVSILERDTVAGRGREDEEGLVIRHVNFLGGYQFLATKIRRPELVIFPTRISLYSPRTGSDPILDIDVSEIRRIAISNAGQAAYLEVETGNGVMLFRLRSLSATELRQALQSFEAIARKLDGNAAANPNLGS